MIRRAVRIAVLFAVVLFATGQDSRLWKVIGPGGGGAMFYPAISPHDASQVMVGCDMTGSYLTTDAGASWRMFNLRSPASFFVFDPVDPRTLYAYAKALWRSEDQGQSWSIVYPQSAEITGFDMLDDHAGIRYETSTPHAAATALAIDPTDSSQLFLATKTPALLASSDHGRTWREIRKLVREPMLILIDPRSPKNDRTIYVVERGAVAVRRARQWVERPAPGSKPWIDAGAGFVTGAELPVLYAISETDMRVSTDAGTTWRASVLPATARFAAIAASAQNGSTAYLSYEELRMDGAEYFGVARTRDSGKTWDLVWKDSEKHADASVKDAWVNERFGPGWGGRPLSLGVSPKNPEIAYATDLGRTLRTTDGGKTWIAVYSKKTGDGYVNTGLNVTTAYGVHWDPFHPNRMFIDYTDISLFRSEDGGKSWISSSKGIPRRWENTVYWTVFDPSVPGRAWAAASETHDLPRPKMWRKISPSSFLGGVVISDDGGVTWRESNAGMPESAITHIVLDPASPPNARILYAAGFGKGVYKSVDGGKSWALKNEGIVGAEPFAWRLAVDSNRTLYLVVARRSEHGEIGEGDGALYKSTDGAEHWRKVSLPQGVNGPNGLIADAKDSRRLYLAAWRRDVPGPVAGGGIFLSEDGGMHWRPVLTKDQHVYDITQDERSPEILYATGFESNAWRSVDRGETWQRISGFNFKWGHRVIPDPQNPKDIYITTFGGSVWHGPASGDPASKEDIATQSLSYKTK